MATFGWIFFVTLMCIMLFNEIRQKVNIKEWITNKRREKTRIIMPADFGHGSIDPEFSTYGREEMERIIKGEKK